MTSKMRLSLCILMILASAMYGAILIQSPQVASAISGGYVAILLTIFAAVNIWKKQ